MVIVILFDLLGWKRFLVSGTNILAASKSKFITLLTAEGHVSEGGAV